MNGDSTGSSATELIRRMRQAAGLTQAQLAAKLATTQSAVSRWERGHDEPRLSTLEKVSRACGYRLEVSVDLDVDRAQIRQQLSMTPDQRLDAVVNMSRMLASAERLV